MEGKRGEGGRRRGEGKGRKEERGKGKEEERGGGGGRKEGKMELQRQRETRVNGFE